MTQTETQQANLDEIRQLLLSMAEKGQVAEAVDLMVELVRAVRDRNTELELRLRTLLKDKFGRKSETLAKLSPQSRGLAAVPQWSCSPSLRVRA